MAHNKKADALTIIIRVLLFLIIAAVVVLAVNIGVYTYEKYVMREHPLGYSDLIEKYCDEYGLDKYLVYAVVKTESGFEPQAESSMGARGLMQIMYDTYDWISGIRLNEDIDFDDMYNPDDNIRYGCYLIAYHLNNYNDVDCALAAYHAGDGNVNEWLKNSEFSHDGKTFYKIPTRDTAHYVNKVNKAYETYVKLYGG